MKFWNIGEKKSLVCVYTSSDFDRGAGRVLAIRPAPARASLNIDEVATCMRLESDGIIT